MLFFFLPLTLLVLSLHLLLISLHPHIAHFLLVLYSEDLNVDLCSY